MIGRDHLDTGSVASPNRETEAMQDGSDAIADWPLLNALLNTACGASWVSLHHGGGVGIGYSIHAGMVTVADGTDAADRRLERVLTADPGTGVMRHADAGYDLRDRDRARARRSTCRCSTERIARRGCSAQHRRSSPPAAAGGRQAGLHAVSDAALGLGRRAAHRWAGPRARTCPRGASRPPASEDAGGRLSVPGTGGLPHPSRVRRLAGGRIRRSACRAAATSRSPQRGGGIASTVRQTRARLRGGAARRGPAGSSSEMLRLGVTTVECKSGYGLDREDELKLLRVYRRLADEQPDAARPDLSRRACGAGGVPRRSRATTCHC